MFAKNLQLLATKLALLCACCASFLTAADALASPEITGRWLFIDDQSAIDIAPCADTQQGMCARLIALSKQAASLSPQERQKLCSAYILGELKPMMSRAPSAVIRWEGWIIDPEDLLKKTDPIRYRAAFDLLSPVRARLSVLGPLGISYESHQLMRPVIPLSSSAC